MDNITQGQYPERTRVRINTSGEYKMYPMKMEYKTLTDKDGKLHETIDVRFTVLLGNKFSCSVYKKIFFKSAEQINKEVKYLMKYICPECLDHVSKAKDFKSYVEALATLVNKELDRQGEAKERVLLMGRVRVKKGSKFADLSELLTTTGIEIPYLAFIEPNDIKAFYFSEWEMANLICPFEPIEEKPSSNGNGHAKELVSSGWDDKGGDSLPF